MVRKTSRSDENWLEIVLGALRDEGCIVVEDVLSKDFLQCVRSAMYRAMDAIQRDMGDRLRRAGEDGVARLIMKYDPVFFDFLENEEVLAVVDNTVSNTAIMHLQNGFLLPSTTDAPANQLFQARFHQDFPRVLNGYLMSVNTLFAIDEFTQQNGATLVVPGTHQTLSAPDGKYLADNAECVECPAGSMLVFDSTLWHAAGQNTSGKDRLAINHQFTRSYVKQQIDYVRALGDNVITAQKPRTQQLLGWYTRVVTSLDEFYQPSDKRLYRAGQG